MIRVPLLVLLAGMAEAGEVHSTGSFVGGRTTGDVEIIRDGDQFFVRLAPNFLHEGAPDPWVALGQDGFRRDALLGPLREDSGAQLYEIPARLAETPYNQVYIWCENFSTSLGRAWLKPAQ
ncbi:MAG: DM13 domain-containing protein [Pseudomonadota bacterium]